eukprot:CAMPEP_0114998216 /NCGR_PEP_ID=MMETSP0216-20121206/15368_1 /TAXON_ID=223996 /ORGANISM="Protocruzia adherens, Strain Boccale" /LENGTH=183 /DNA_ID=CAMNT_0002362757 /DNA_START=68 /DNA_END=619 /DNA_ORIENTATION=+
MKIAEFHDRRNDSVVSRQDQQRGDVMKVMGCRRFGLFAKWIDCELDHSLDGLLLNEHLSVVDLRYNKLDRDKTKQLGKVLENKRAIQILELRCLRNLSAGIQMQFNLTQIALRGNKIGPDGARLLAELLRTMTTLEVLYLSHNRIGSQGVRVFAEALKANFSLKELDIGGSFALTCKNSPRST